MSLLFLNNAHLRLLNIL